MKLLIYGLNFSPELVGIGKFTGELAAYLAQKGHQVTVITTPPYYPAWKVENGYHASRYRVEETANLRVIRCPLWVPKKLSGSTRALHLLSFAISSAPALYREASKNPELLFCVAPALVAAPAGAIAGRLFNIRTWLHMQDFEIDTAFKLGMLNSRTLSRSYSLLSQIERETYKHFDQISSISHKMVERLHSKGVPPEKTCYFPNWVDGSQIRPTDDENGYRTQIGLEPGCKVVLYSGSMSEKQGIEVMLDSARMLNDRTDIQFVLCGEGPAKQKLQEAAKGSRNIHFLPLQPVEKLNMLLNLADMHVLPQKRGATDLVMPSKLMGMLASSKPVIAGCEPGSELYRVVIEVGVTVTPEDSKALTEAILALANDPERCAWMGMRGRKYCLEQFSKEVVIDRFIEEAIKVIGTKA